MSRKEITLKFVFDPVEEEEYTYYKLDKIERVQSTLSEAHLDAWLEMICQSDKFTLDFPNDVVHAMEEGEVDV